jgi:hypothetical protein
VGVAKRIESAVHVPALSSAPSHMEKQTTLSLVARQAQPVGSRRTLSSHVKLPLCWREREMILQHRNSLAVSGQILEEAVESFLVIPRLIHYGAVPTTGSCTGRVEVNTKPCREVTEQWLSVLCASCEVLANGKASQKIAEGTKSGAAKVKTGALLDALQKVVNGLHCFQTLHCERLTPALIMRRLVRLSPAGKPQVLLCVSCSLAVTTSHTAGEYTTAGSFIAKPIKWSNRPGVAAGQDQPQIRNPRPEVRRECEGRSPNQAFCPGVDILPMR